MNTIERLVEQTQTFYCLDCGVCTGSCPVSRVYQDFSPRMIVERSLYELEDSSDQSIWNCLTCSRCYQRCPANINFPEFIRLIRDEARSRGISGTPAHHGMIQSIMAMHTGTIKQNRTYWIDNSVRVNPASDTMYFVGCRPYFDVIFRDIGAGSIKGALNVVRLLNAIGIEPLVSENERCCGHDALWNGDEETFRKLALLNIDIIKSTHVKRVVFSCPEGYHTFKEYYPRYVGKLDFEILHLNELLAQSNGALRFKPSEGIVTYHDPCRLGRMSHIYDSPRQLIGKVPGITLVEMERSRENGICCGTSGWMNCSGCSKMIQVERLKEAENTGASTLVTACPKCSIHFNCATRYFGLDIKVRELTDILVENLVEA